MNTQSPERDPFTQGHIWEKVLQQEPAKLGVNIIVLPEWWLVSGSLKGWVQIVKYLRCLAGMTGVYIWGRGEESSKQRNKMKKKICRQLKDSLVWTWGKLVPWRLKRLSPFLLHKLQQSRCELIMTGVKKVGTEEINGRETMKQKGWITYR